MPTYRSVAALLAAAATCLLLAACSTLEPAPRSSSAARVLGEVRDSVTVEEVYVTEENREDELDSLATWIHPDGATWVIATAKSSHRLVVFDGDSGERLRSVGRRGAGAGEFTRPNGLLVYGDHAFVTERDAPRVQVLELPEFRPAGSFGQQELRSPYGIWLHESAPGELLAYVTDSFMYGARHEVVPPLAELDRRVRRYRLQRAADAFQAEYLGAFGDTSERGALRMVESIAGDPLHDRLLVADEDRRNVSTLREYTLDGRYTGVDLPDGSFVGEAEGVALWSCGAESGYWVAVDQLTPLTTFHLYARADLAPRGSFTGRLTANTDGVALHAAATPRFPGGALYAVHDDRAVTAFDLRDVVRALRLDPDCLR
ncbi:phytase [Luteimonas sp. RD2P54]|uniref:Phytase n=1 Tax=Luteimonas endophytica TaxID=3042023 RepID=A0ABT6J9N3_9GAMM|nr:phytase [Luteimonas endophytica]MDH5823529.1 phytase [Luteimonas endophytica]